MKTSMLIKALQNAIGKSKPEAGLIFHSDRGRWDVMIKSFSTLNSCMKIYSFQNY